MDAPQHRPRQVPARVRKRVLSLIRRGLLSVTGAAYVCDCSKQLVSQWCEREGIDPRKAEMRRWADLKAQFERDTTGLRRES
jgi:hypothetical protein